MTSKRNRLAFVVSHPIQYYAPLYQRLAQRNDLEIKVFFTWHGGGKPVRDHGFRQSVAWDIPLTSSYDFEVVPNIARDPGTHHFWGLNNPDLVNQVEHWQPDWVHVSGWAWHSHLSALRAFSRLGLPTLFRGDSHLLDQQQRGPRWWLKRALLRRVYSWPTAFLVVGSANRAYYEAFDVPGARMWPCPHSVDVARFAEPRDTLEREAAQWKVNLNIPADRVVLLYAGKFEPKKRPVELMRAVQRVDNPALVLVMVGGGELEAGVHAIADSQPERFRVLPFQNQSRMPIVYRLGDLVVLPSAYGETWGLAVNEALACGRPVVASSRVGCAADVIRECCGRVFPWDDLDALVDSIRDLTADVGRLVQMRTAASRRAQAFDIRVTEAALVASLQCRRSS